MDYINWSDERERSNLRGEPVSTPKDGRGNASECDTLVEVPIVDTPVDDGGANTVLGLPLLTLQLLRFGHTFLSHHKR